MTDPQNNPTPSMDDLTALLLGNTDSAAPSPEPQPESESAALIGDEFSQLQALLVKPDVQQMRAHIARIEQDLPTLHARLERVEIDTQELQSIQARLEQLEAQFPELLALRDRLESWLEGGNSTQTPSMDPKTSLALVKLLMPIMASMLDHKLESLEARLLTAIQAHSGGAITLPPSLSIRLSGIDADPT